MTSDLVLTALRGVIDPDLRTDIVSLKFVKNVAVADGRAAFTVELSSPSAVARERVREALAREELIEDGDPLYIQAANDFHYVVGSMTGNRVLDLISTALKELYTSRVIGGGLANETTAPNIRREHREIGEAILAGNGDLAEELTRKHMNLYLGRVRSLPGVGESLIIWS